MKVQETMLSLYVNGQAKVEACCDRLLKKMQDEEGASTVEYALVIAVIVVGIILAAKLMFDPLKDFFTGVVDKIKQLAGV